MTAVGRTRSLSRTRPDMTRHCSSGRTPVRALACSDCAFHSPEPMMGLAAPVKDALEGKPHGAEPRHVNRRFHPSARLQFATQADVRFAHSDLYGICKRRCRKVDALER